MQGLHQIGGVLWNLFIQEPLAVICGVIMLIFMLRGMGWHAMYVYALLMGGVIVSKTVGFSEFLAGVIVGVIGNELFRIIRTMLDKERKPGA